jgi:hypothetical protein
VEQLQKKYGIVPIAICRKKEQTNLRDVQLNSSREENKL